MFAAARSFYRRTSAAGLFVMGYHLALLVILPVYLWFRTPSWGLVIASVVLMFLTEIGIGAAYHRFYAHRAYSMSPVAEGGLLFLGTMALQGSVLQWAYDHRLHHSYVDTDRDPYSIKKGFWHAHVLWLFEESKPIDEKRVADLVGNPLVMFQYRHFLKLSFGSSALAFLLFGWIFGDFVGAFVLTWWTRLLVSHHLTWFINSLAHCWGARTYSKEQSAVDNFVLAFLTVGEGYHNYHHTFASDYRNGVRWFHFDPVKWTIWTLSKLGLARDLKRHNRWAIKRRLLHEDRKLLANWLARAGERRAELEARVRELGDAMHEKIARIRALADEMKRARAVEREHRAVRVELRRLERSLRRDWADWTRLGDLVWRAAGAPSR